MNNLNTKEYKQINLFNIIEILISNFKIILTSTILFFLFSFYINSTIFKKNNIFMVSGKYSLDIDQSFYLKSANKFLQRLSGNAYIYSAMSTSDNLSNEGHLSDVNKNNNIVLESRGYFEENKDQINFLDSSYVSYKLKQIIKNKDFINKVLSNFENDIIYDYANIEGFQINSEDVFLFSEEGEKFNGISSGFDLRVYSPIFLDKDTIDITYNMMIAKLNSGIYKLFVSTYKNHISNVENTISLLKEDNKQLLRRYDIQVKDRIIILEEQLKIAKAINFKEPSPTYVEDTNSGLELLDSSKEVLISIQTKKSTYDYLRGYVAIEAEILALKNRYMKKTFIPSIRTNEEAILLLESPYYREDILQNSNVKIFANNEFNPFILDSKINIAKQNNGFSLNFQIFVSFLLSFIGFIASLLSVVFYREYKLYKTIK